MKGVHICRFDSTEQLHGKARTYEAVKAAALKAGRFSTFEASSTAKNAVLFTDLMRDPEVEIFEMGFPWHGIRRRGEQPQVK